ncbi:cardiolipin synthase 2 [Paenibacillus faecis]|uniref:Cardiolipin synthase n=1 Tax=Paenibacillus faecis TaxID=862114 RepID=A0A5D0CQB8_9BACL|nr:MULTISPECIES: cardiolipin synthase [Paenibacillus]MCA1294070.1 cardiolipin synthase [Paenibacillus sp. alder61]TYA11948.1 cardiolipin synthase [Paenibacillus faecis]GIO86489.1 cardiolipin synthase 2 [Paenibacillus faecis]
MRRGLQIILIAAILFAFYFFGFGVFGKFGGMLVSIFQTLTVVTIGLAIFMENRNPSSTMAWILVLALLPVVGLILYFLLGQNYFKRRKFDKKAEEDRKSYERIDHNGSMLPRDLSQFTPGQQRLLQMSQRIARTPFSMATRTRVLTNGEETFSTLLKELKKAQHHIHMEYYIYRADDIGREIQKTLIEKAKAGVEVRFMFDAVGSLGLPKSFVNELREAGVKVGIFGEVRFLALSSRVNYRNHRKIVVIDGNTGFIGGLNVGDEYLSRSKTYGFWRDTHMLVKGEAVRSMQVIFLQDWQYVTGERIMDVEYLSPEMEQGCSGAVQVIPSGPDNESKALKNIFFAMITSAKKSVWLATPYFIPDEDIQTALRVAALSGIDVRILFPAKPDKWLPFLASHSYFPSLLEAGVKIFEYEKGFLHSKLLIVDGEVATVGTANMDMRSFHLNFEVNVLLVQADSISKIVQDFERDLLSTTRIKRKAFMKKKIVVRLMESAARLMSPLL